MSDPRGGVGWGSRPDAASDAVHALHAVPAVHAMHAFRRPKDKYLKGYPRDPEGGDDSHLFWGRAS